MFVVLVVAVSAVGVVAFKKYARKSSYKCNSGIRFELRFKWCTVKFVFIWVADVIYYKDEDNNVF